MQKYEVGQILYLTNEKTFKIIPVQIVEEVVRTTIDGSFKTYHIQFPDKNKTTVDISDVKYKCFKTENEVKDYLMSNTRKAIDELLHTANELKAISFTSKLTSQEKLEPAVEDEVVQPEFEGGIIKIDLGDGTVGKIKKSNLKL